jgi:ABC-2 type transport system ATP-binding protein
VYSDRFPRRVVEAVKDVTLTVNTGEVFGLLGPNRAGKTTLVKLLLTLCRPTSGTVMRLGRPASDRRTLAKVGYVHENQAFPRYWDATGLLHYYGALTMLPQPEVQKRVPALLRRVGLADRAREPIQRFSKGMVQRLGLAQALLGEPELLVLDEPTEGLDLTGRELVHEAVADMRKQGKTVILVSHVLADIEQLCDRVGVVVAGRLTHQGALASLTQTKKDGESRSLAEGLRALYDHGKH